MDRFASAVAKSNFWSLQRNNTNDIDVALERLHALYGSNAKMDLSGSKDGFRMGLVTASLGDLRISKFNLAGYSMSRTMGDVVQISVPIAGRFLSSSSTSEVEFTSKSMNSPVVGPYQQVRITVERGTGVALLIPAKSLIDRIEVLLRKNVSRDRVLGGLAGTVNLNGALGRSLARNIRAALTELTELEIAGIGGLAVRGFEETLLNLAAANLCPSIATEFERESTACSPALVRAARDYLVEQALEPIEIAKLAATLGISMRALQENFQRYYGQSPRDFILEQRLARARSILQYPTAFTTVLDVSARCGFSDVGRFSAKYRDRFKEVPSETLRRART